MSAKSLLKRTCGAIGKFLRAIGRGILAFFRWFGRVPFWIKSVVVLLSLVVAMGLFTLCSSMKAGSERSRYEALLTSHKLEDFQEFLDDFPQSRHARDVANRMEQLRIKLDEWRLLMATPTAYELRSFQMRYADPYFSKRIEQMLDSIEWLDAKRTGTAEAFTAYLDLHPKGAHADEARKSGGKSGGGAGEVHQLSYEFQSIVLKFFRAMNEENTSAMMQYLSPTLTGFLGSTRKPEDAARAAAAMVKRLGEGAAILPKKFFPLEKQNDTTYILKFEAEQTSYSKDDEVQTATLQGVATLTHRIEIAGLSLTGAGAQGSARGDAAQRPRPRPAKPKAEESANAATSSLEAAPQASSETNNQPTEHKTE